MKTRAAVIHAIGEKWKIQELDLDEPGDNEVRIKVMASGLCHSDDHFVTGDLAVDLPMVGGHEGAGVVEAVGSKVTRVQVGDHVSTMFIPACGQCVYCARGMQYICNNGAGMETGMSMDGNPHFRDTNGAPIGGATRLGTFSNYLICHEMQTVKLPDDIPFELACLVSCGVATGFGAAVNGGIKPGDVVLVLGLGGVGANAVQGARHAGADHVIVIEPAENKHELAAIFGATEAYSSIAQAQQRIDHLTNGQGVDVAIITVGRVDGDIIGDAFRAVGKSGTCVLVSVGQAEAGISISPQDFTNFAKHLQGVMYGNCNPTADIPKFLKMYRDGTLKLDELITRRYALEEINEAVSDMHAARNIRGVIVHQH